VATLPPAPKAVDELSVFDILNIFCKRWFINKDHLTVNVLSAQKDEDRRFSWVDFSPPFHTHLVQRMHSLLPPLCPVAKGKKVMFMFMLEILSGEGPDQKGFWKVPKKHPHKKACSQMEKTTVPVPPAPSIPPPIVSPTRPEPVKPMPNPVPSTSSLVAHSVSGDDVVMAELRKVIAKTAELVTYAPSAPSSPTPAKPYPLFPFPAFPSGADQPRIVRWLRAARVRKLSDDAVGDEINRVSPHLFNEGSLLEKLYIIHFLDKDPRTTQLTWE
jgi:hypothetical protein